MDGCFDLRSRLPLSQCSQPTPSRLLADAFNHVTLNSQQDLPLSQDHHNILPLSQEGVGPCSQLGSQELILGTQDFITPAEQQYETVYDPNNVEVNLNRSPIQLSPRTKRRRQVPEYGSEDLSQSSHNVSYLEPSCSMRPPQSKLMKPRLARPQSPPCHTNPFLSGFDSDTTCGISQRLPRGPPPTSRYRSDFKELGVLGHGNFSKVFRVLHRLDGREYAIKRSIKAVTTEAARVQWLQEMQALAAVDGHPNVVRYYSAWSESVQEGEHFYIQLEKCDVSLGAKFCVQQPFTEEELVDLLQQMCCALQHIHSLGIAHLDVKPDNIYTTADGHYKLGDFGLAALVSGLKKVAMNEGDARYLSLELLKGDYTNLDKSDVFALGATLYELATGVALPSGGQTYHDIRQGRLRLMPNFSASFQKMLHRLMSPNPKDRPTPEKVLKSSLITMRAQQGMNSCLKHGSESHSHNHSQPHMATTHGSQGQNHSFTQQLGHGTTASHAGQTHIYGMLNFRPV